MKKQYINIYGKDFLLCGTIDHTPNINQRSVTECYDRSSSTKQAIYNNWEKWFIANNILNYGVESYNCNFFTLGSICEYNGKKYYLYITRCYNRCYEII